MHWSCQQPYHKGYHYSHFRYINAVDCFNIKDFHYSSFIGKERVSNSINGATQGVLLVEYRLVTIAWCHLNSKRSHCVLQQGWPLPGALTWQLHPGLLCHSSTWSCNKMLTLNKPREFLSPNNSLVFHMKLRREASYLDFTDKPCYKIQSYN